MNKKIMIITPFYPITHRKDLFEDTKAVNYLLKEFPKGNNLLIVHSFMHGFKKIPKNFFKVIPIKKGYKNYLYKDNYGNPVFFFENLLFIPKSLKLLNYFNKSYSRLVMQYFEQEHFNPNIVVVHFPTYYMKFINEFKDIPRKITVLHSYDIKNIKKVKNDIYWKEFFDTFDAIGFRSFVIKKQFEELIHYQGEKFMCLSGIPEKFINQEIFDKNYNTRDKINILYAGRLDTNKNVSKVINALSKVKNYNYEFTIIGDGDQKSHILNQIKDLKLNKKVNLKGIRSREETFNLMKKADIFIMLSKKETLGLVYLEAMAAGCIVIGTRGQGIDGIIQDGVNGFLTSSYDDIEIFQTIEKAFSLNPKQQEEMRLNARNTIKVLNDKKVSKDYYNNVTAGLLGDYS